MSPWECGAGGEASEKASEKASEGGEEGGKSKADKRCAHTVGWATSVSQVHAGPM